MTNPMLPPGMAVSGKPLAPGSMAPNPMLPPPAAGPGLGFQLWAQDPLNNMKVQHSMSQPDQPLQPGAGNAPQMASVNPPQKPPMASVTPPSADPAPVNVSSLSAMPDMPAFATPPVQSGAQAQLGKDQAEFERVKSTGSGASQVKNPFLRTLAEIGNVASPLLGRGAMLIPGTTLHNRLLQMEDRQNIGDDLTAVKSQQEGAESMANVNKANAQANLANTNAAAVPTKLEDAETKNAQNHALQLAKNGQMEVNGQIVDDPNSAALGAKQALTRYHTAQVALDQAKTELAAAGNDPNSPAYKLAQQKAQTAQQNASAAGERAQAYMLNATAGNLGTTPNGQQINGSATVGGAPVGSRFAPQASKSQQNVAKMNDVAGAVNNTDAALKALEQSGGSLNSASMAAALADNTTSASQWAQGKVAATLSPQERAAVIAIKSARENLMAMRSSVGGGVSDSQIDRIIQQLPSASSPDYKYSHAQLEQIRNTISRLSQGVVTVKGGNTVNLKTPPEGAPPAPKPNAMKPPTQGKASDPLGIR